MSVTKFKLILAVLIAFNAHAQNLKYKQDSLKFDFEKDSTWIYRFKMYRPYVDVDQYQTFINGNSVTERGVSLGVRYKNVHVFGLSVHGIIARDRRRAVSRFADTIFITEQTDFRYLSFLYQYTLFNNRYMALFMPTHFGVGKYKIISQDINHLRPVIHKEGGAIPASMGLTFVLKPVKWVGISGTGGYRYVLDRNPKQQFSGFFYGYGIWLDIQQIMRDTQFYGFRKPRYKRALKELSM